MPLVPLHACPQKVGPRCRVRHHLDSVVPVSWSSALDSQGLWVLSEGPCCMQIGYRRHAVHTAEPEPWAGAVAGHGAGEVADMARLHGTTQGVVMFAGSNGALLGAVEVCSLCRLLTIHCRPTKSPLVYLPAVHSLPGHVSKILTVLESFRCCLGATLYSIPSKTGLRHSRCSASQ